MVSCADSSRLRSILLLVIQALQLEAIRLEVEMLKLYE
jgi:hypothetical protein